MAFDPSAEESASKLVSELTVSGAKETYHGASQVGDAKLSELLSK